ncbi:MIP/aquaporin family protein [Flavobacterium sp. J27]|uniref:MIP/aquaporin family protein n=1 Tax=Flavobacterium sp. J27 TaxID=2060419 RepID=UPI0010316A87|nr:MIP family channel protein [Flavobacterium sp. J27]
MRRYIAEIIGTFAIVFCGTGAIIIDQETNGTISHSGIAITFGLIVMAMIYALGSISGAHFNPAVTIAFSIANKFKKREIIPYVISQFLGAILASGLLYLLFPSNAFLGATIPSGSNMQSFILEFILTFLLMLVILSVAHGSKEQGMFAGIAIGSVVGLEAMFAGPICGASMNPARSLGPAFVADQMEQLWIYLLAPTLGAAVAVFIWSYLTNNKLKEKIIKL